MSVEHPTVDFQSHSQQAKSRQLSPEEQQIRSELTADSLPLASGFYVTPTAAAFNSRAPSGTPPPCTSPSHAVSRQASRALPGSMQSMYGSAESNSSGQLQASNDGALAGLRASVEESSEIHLVAVEHLAGATVAVEHYTGGRYAAEVEQNDTFWPCTFNLSKVIMVSGCSKLQQHRLVAVLQAAPVQS
eukprot:GHRQ01009998.1.p1 GENE.GHRQ01009998.1~~GHRQ01009998.1.p1  ORF type:complete len:189 (+),score=48.41 GHRQ01009998.1:473-1039(+)